MLISKKFYNFEFKNFFSFFRSVFPKWNFFDRIAYQFEIEWKTPDQNIWRKMSFEQKRNWFSLFFNAEFNLALAHVSLIQQFAAEIQEISSDEKKLSSYKMLVSLLKLKLIEKNTMSNQFQFKILAANSNEIINIYTSDLLELKNI